MKSWRLRGGIKKGGTLQNENQRYFRVLKESYTKIEKIYQSWCDVYHRWIQRWVADSVLVNHDRTEL